MARARKPQPIEPEQLLVFAALARAGGVRAAATALGVPRSTVSRRLQQLEAAIGAPLVVRDARRFQLTELGREVAERGQQLEAVMRDSEELASRAQGEPAGMLRVDAAPVLAEEILPEVVAQLAREHPRLAIAVRSAVDYIDVRNGTADVVLRARKIDDAADVYAVHLGTSITGCYVSPAYEQQHGVPAEPEELVDHDCLVVGPRLPATWTFGKDSNELAVAVGGRIRVDSFRLARSLAVLGAGVLRTATVFADPLVAAGELVPVLERYWSRTPIYAAHTGKPPAPKVRAFLALVREATARALPADRRAKWRSA